VYKILKEPTGELRYVNVSLLRSTHQHVSAIHVAIFRMMGTKIQIKLCVEITPQLKSYNYIMYNNYYIIVII